MAATLSSPWAKPGAWALDSEEHEAAELEQQQHQAKIEAQPLADFPSLSVAAAAKPKKKNKPQKVSLAEFSFGGGPKPAEPVGLTHEDRLALPTGPRERTAEELEKGRLGGGFKSYGADRNREDSNSKWGSQRREGGGGFGKESDRDAPSRADEADDWGRGKKSLPEKRERVGFGFGSQSKADESDSWVTNKTSFSSEGRRPGGGGFDRDRKIGFGSNGGGADSETWGRKREESNGGGGFERERKVGLGFNSNGGGADSDSWGRRREESNGGTESNGRPRLKLQPRTLPVTLPPPVVNSNESSPVAVPVALEIVPRPKGADPFGAARPREEVLAEKGKDWKKIDEELEAVKLKEKEAVAAEGESFGKRSFGMGNGRSGDRTEGVWRKPVVAEAEGEGEGEARPQSAGNDESRSSNSEEPEPEPENENEDENVTEN